MKKGLYNSIVVMLVLVALIGCSKKATDIAVSISSNIDWYTPAMSTVPGLPLEVNISGVDEQSNMVYIWKVEEGDFLTWNDGIVNILGNECILEESKIYWIPDGERKENKDTFQITVEIKNNETKVLIGEKTIEIYCSNNFKFSILK